MSNVATVEVSAFRVDAALRLPSLFIKIIPICCELSTILIPTNIFINATVVSLPEMGGKGHLLELQAYVICLSH